MLGLSSSLVKGGASLLTFVKDNLKLYLDFKSNKSDTLKFPSEGSTSFNGTSDYIAVPDNDSFDFGTGNMSVCAWINRASENTNDVIVAKKGSNELGWYFRVHSTDKIFLQVSDGTTDWYDYSSSTIPTGEWVHVCATWNPLNQKGKFYINGVESAGQYGTTANITGTTNNTSELRIGRDSDGYTTDWFHGSIANLAMWTRELEPEEIQSIMNKSYSQLKGVEKTSLVSWWALDSQSNGLVQPATGETLGIEKITSNTETDWTPYGSNDVDPTTNGVSVTNSDNDARGAVYNISGLTNGSLYKVVFNARSSNLDGNLKTYFNASTTYFSPAISTTDTQYTIYGYAGSSNSFQIFALDPDNTIFIENFSVKEVTSNTGVVTGATTTTSVYGGNAPILPRAVDVAKEGQADAIGDGSASFNGSTDYIQIDSSNFSNLQPYTISAWFKIDTLQASAILAWGDESHYERRSMFIWNGGSGSVWKLIPSIYGENPVGATALEINRWYHGALVVNPTAKTYEIYLNGILDGSGSFSNDFVSWGGTTGYIGKTGSNERFDGNISQVGLWRGELTQAQIQSVMESTSYSKIPADVKSILGSELSGSDIDFTLSGTQSASTTGTYWITEGNWTISDGKAIYDDSGNSAITVASATIEDAGIYKLTFDISDASSQGQIKFKAGGTTLVDTALYSNGSHTLYFNIASSLGSAQIFKIDGKTGGSSFKIDNISIKKVTCDLVAYYPLDGDNSIPALSFDGTDDTIQTSAHDTLVDTTYTFWAKSDVTGANGGLFGHGGVTKSSFHFNYFGATGGARFFLGGNYFKKWDIDEQDDGQWHHYAIIADADSIADTKLYVDGVEKTASTTSSSGSPEAFTQSLTIGSDATNGNEWEGSIAQFAVYSDLKDADFIKAQYDKAIDADFSSDTNLVGYWKMNNGTTVNDLSGNGNNGTVSGATLIQNAVALDSTDNNNDGTLK